MQCTYPPQFVRKFSFIKPVLEKLETADLKADSSCLSSSMHSVAFSLQQLLGRARGAVSSVCVLNLPYLQFCSLRFQEPVIDHGPYILHGKFQNKIISFKSHATLNNVMKSHCSVPSFLEQIGIIPLSNKSLQHMLPAPSHLVAKSDDSHSVVVLVPR